MHCAFVPIITITGSTHKRIGLDTLLRQSTAQAFSVISSGNRIADIRAELQEQQDVRPVYVLTSSARGWANEIPIEDNRILRTPEERAQYVLEKTGVLTEDITDSGAHTDTGFIEGLAETIGEEGYRRILVPVGGGTLYLAAARAADQAGTGARVEGFTPKGANAIFTTPDQYAEREGKLYWCGGRQQSIADKLVAPYTSLRTEIEATFEQGHCVHEATELELKTAYAMASALWRDVTEPSSAAGICGLLPTHYRDEPALILMSGTTGAANTLVRARRANCSAAGVTIHLPNALQGCVNTLTILYQGSRLFIEEHQGHGSAQWIVDAERLLAYGYDCVTDIRTGAVSDIDTRAIWNG